MKDGELVHFIERHQVEDRSAEEIAADLKMHLTVIAVN